MSKLARKSGSLPDEEREQRGPNLILLYSLLTLALLGAMAFAAMIVFPFYQRR